MLEASGCGSHISGTFCVKWGGRGGGGGSLRAYEHIAFFGENNLYCKSQSAIAINNNSRAEGGF